MRVIFTHDVTDNTGALNKFSITAVTINVHRVQNTAMYRLKAVSNVRQGAVDNHTHRVAEKAIFHNILERSLFNPRYLGCDNLAFNREIIFV